MSKILRVLVLKGGYGVMYSAHDGIHMPTVMSYIVSVMSSTEWVVMTDTVDVMADRMGFKSDIVLCFHKHSVCDIIYSGYDITNIVGAMTYKQWYDSREDVMS